MSTEPDFTSAQPLDLARIEADAHRLRAEALRDGVRWLGARIAALWSSTPTKGAKTA
ncbi:MAG: RSP_7527 family protein [Gemmobacter sp.]